MLNYGFLISCDFSSINFLNFFFSYSTENASFSPLLELIEKQNNFTVIYCGLWSQTYDLGKELQFQVLPGNTSSKDCNSINEAELPAEAQKRLESYF